MLLKTFYQNLDDRFLSTLRLNFLAKPGAGLVEFNEQDFLNSRRLTFKLQGVDVKKRL